MQVKKKDKHYVKTLEFWKGCFTFFFLQAKQAHTGGV